MGREAVFQKSDVRETILAWGFFAALVFGVVIMTGTLTSGFHLVDDWELARYVDQMTLENKSFRECLRAALEFDLTLRFRPLYYINRVLMAYVFGINLTAMSVVKALEIVVALTALYFCARQLKCGWFYAALFSLTVMVGYQSAVWWKLGPQESYDIMMFALGFYLLLMWLGTDKKRYAFLSIGCFFLMSLYKEPFILMLPFVGLYVLYAQTGGSRVTFSGLWEAIKRRFPYLLALGTIFAVEMCLIVFVIGVNNYSYVGLDKSLDWDFYVQVWREAMQKNMKWYVRFGMLMWMILLTYGERLLELAWLGALAVAAMLPQIVTYSKTGLQERYILPWVFGFAFFFVIAGAWFRHLSGKRRAAYLLCLLLMLAANGRVMLLEAKYFAYRGQGIGTMLNETLALVKGTDKKVLDCFHPNMEACRTMYHWFRLQGYDEVFYWNEEDKSIKRFFGEIREAPFSEIDVVMMYNREDRHWDHEVSLDLSDFTEKKCGTVTMYVRNEK